MLLSTAATLDWAVTPAKSVERIDYHETWRFEVGVDIDALPDQTRAALTGAFDFYGEAGKLCTATLEQPLLQAYVLPEDNHDEFDGAQLLELARRPGEYDAVSLLLVADFDAGPACAGALWAREARLPPPRLLVPKDIDDEGAALLADQRARVLDSNEGQELARQYRSHAEDTADAMPWASYAQGKGQIWVDAQADAQLLIVAFGDGMSKPCFPTPSYLSVQPTQAVQANPWPRPLWGLPTPSAVFDADLDGRYEMLFFRPWGGLVHVELVGETMHLNLTIPDDSSYNC